MKAVTWQYRRAADPTLGFHIAFSRDIYSIKRNIKLATYDMLPDVPLRKYLISINAKKAIRKP